MREQEFHDLHCEYWDSAEIRDEEEGQRITEQEERAKAYCTWLDENPRWADAPLPY